MTEQERIHNYNLKYYREHTDKIKTDTKAYRLKNLKKVKLSLLKTLYGRFGWTPKWHNAQLTKYKRRCAICLKKRRLCVDHKDKVRGLLCLTCNSMLGLVYENVRTLRRAALYVLRHRTHSRLPSIQTVHGKHTKNKNRLEKKKELNC